MALNFYFVFFLVFLIPSFDLFGNTILKIILAFLFVYGLSSLAEKNIDFFLIFTDFNNNLSILNSAEIFSFKIFNYIGHFFIKYIDGEYLLLIQWSFLVYLYISCAVAIVKRYSFKGGKLELLILLQAIVFSFFLYLTGGGFGLISFLNISGVASANLIYQNLAFMLLVFSWLTNNRRFRAAIITLAVLVHPAAIGYLILMLLSKFSVKYGFLAVLFMSMIVGFSSVFLIDIYSVYISIVSDAVFEDDAFGFEYNYLLKYTLSIIAALSIPAFIYYSNGRLIFIGIKDTPVTHLLIFIFFIFVLTSLIFNQYPGFSVRLSYVIYLTYPLLFLYVFLEILNMNKGVSQSKSQ
jgi:hypothetical protein